MATAQPVSLWQWMPTRAPVASTHVEHDVGDPGREHAAVGVAQRHDVGPGLGRGPEHLQGVVAVGAVAVEEVLGVEEDPLPLGGQVGDGVTHHREVLLQRGAQRQLDVAVVGLGDQRHHRGARVAQRGHQRVVGGLHAGAAGGAERGQLGVLQVELLARAAEELGVLGVGAGPAALDEAHPELVDRSRDVQLVLHREVEALLLGAVAQRGVVDVEGLAVQDVSARCVCSACLPRFCCRRLPCRASAWCRNKKTSR